MPINTNFGFEHQDVQKAREAQSVLANVEEQPDLLGMLRALVGGSPDVKASRTWSGTGFNMIWRPNFPSSENPVPHFLQLNMIGETFSMTDITGGGIANRALHGPDILLGGIAYTQEIKDTFDNSDQHFEPGVFNFVPKTEKPDEPDTIVRMGSIPHGTAINMQGVGFVHDGPPQFEELSITPFKIGDPSSKVPFPNEEDLSSTTTARTDLQRVATLTQAQLDNPNLFLEQANVGKNITKSTVLIFSTDVADNPPAAPSLGGGAANIAFLEGPTGDPNSDVPLARSIFWVNEGTAENGAPLLELQYSQTVLLDFAGLSWPHITVATLSAQDCSE